MKLLRLKRVFSLKKLIVPSTVAISSPFSKQIFWSFSICLSAHISLGSYNKRKNNVFSQCVALGFLNSFTSFISGFVVFGVLGFMSAETGLPISEVVKGGPGLAFIVYPKAITLMPGAKFWGATFFVMIFLLGIDSQFVCTEGIVTVAQL